MSGEIKKGPVTEIRGSSSGFLVSLRCSLHLCSFEQIDCFAVYRRSNSPRIVLLILSNLFQPLMSRFPSHFGECIAT